MTTKIRASRNRDWAELIKAAEMKLGRLKLKTKQIEALIGDFRLKSRSGVVSPQEMASLGDDLSKLLH